MGRYEARVTLNLVGALVPQRIDFERLDRFFDALDTANSSI